MEYLIQSHKNDDSRALLKEELDALLGNNPLKPLDPFIEFVKKHEELELCFRGNSEKEPRVCIYYRNNIIIDVYVAGRIRVSFNHARYCKNWEEYYNSLRDTFGFNCKDLNESDDEVNIGYITRPMYYKGREPLTYDQIEDLYMNILKPMYLRYFEVAGKENVPDYFKKGELVKPDQKTEKKQQQEIYGRFRSIINGYFFYDLEFAQRHENIQELRNDKLNNKPDMQAIRFDKNGKPDRLVFVEVKCTGSAMQGESGIVEHLRKMKLYDENKLINRRKEACDIMNQYAQLGLRGLSEKNHFNYEDFKDLELEILLVFTNDAINIWETDGKFVNDRLQTTKVEYADASVQLYRI